MGNQNTSGVVEDEGARNEAADAAVLVGNKIMVQENTAEAEDDKIPQVEKLAFDDDKDEIEDPKGSVEGSDDVMDISTNGSDLVENISKLIDEEQEQPCTLTEETQNPSQECTIHEAGSTTSDIQELQDILIKEALEQEQPCILPEEIQNPSQECTTQEAVSTTSDIQQEENILMEETLEADDDHDGNKSDDDSASVEGALLEALVHDEELERDNEPPQKEQSNSIDAAAENEQKNESFPLDHEEKPMNHELGNAYANHTICEDQDQQSDQEINGDDLLEDAEKQENEANDHSMLEKSLHLEENESKPSATENDHKNETCTTEQSEFSTKFDTSEAETPPLYNTSESEAHDEVKKVDAEANSSNVRAQIELRKSPSFDFGIIFETRSEDSDQTPLLYQDRTARRSLSTCSNLRYPNTNSVQIQTEYLRKPLQFEAVQMEEKTILIERSNSKSLNKKQEISSPSRDDDHHDNANISPKGNGRRKARSSLFTTCICCTAAIS